MILTLFILGCFFAFSVFCGLALLGYRSRAHSAEARANRAEGALDEALKRADGMTEIAALAIREAAQAASLDPDEVLRRDLDETYDIKLVRDNQVRASWTLGPNGDVSPITAFCPSCNVSVRHNPTAYPVPCPACQTLIDPVLDNPPEFDISN